MAKLKSLFTLSLFFVFSIILSCNSQEQKMEKVESQKQKISKIITKTFSVKAINKQFVKDTIMNIQSITFDEAGKEQANIYYNLDGTVGWKDVYQYDDNGFKIGSKYYESGEEPVSYYKYEIDSLGRRTAYSALDINTDTLLYDGASRYEADGKIRKDGYVNKKGEFRWNYEYQFDDKGKETGYVYIDLRTGESYPSTYKYVDYNEDGEWTERQIVEKELVQSIEVRDFKYKML